jgi:Sulfotransferase family
VRLRRGGAEAVEERLVWILGGPRTGSTWLLELLCHPLAPSPERPSGSTVKAESGVQPWAVPVNEPYLGVHLAPIVTAGEGGVFTAAEARNLLGPDPSYFFSEQYADAWRPPLRRLILDRLAAQAAAAAEEHGLDSPHVVIKEPNGSEAAPAVMAAVPGARLLFLLRDGRDVLDSMLDAVSPGGWLAGGPDAASVASAADRVDFLRRNAGLWVHRVSAVQRALDAHPPELALTVRYEELRADTRAGLEAILSWLGVDRDDTAVAEAVAANSFEDYPEDVKGKGKPLRFASPGRWRESMAAEEQAAIHEIMGDKLAELGYPV